MPGEDQLAAALTAARAGDPAGLATLYRALQPRLLRYVGSLVGPDAEDVTAETWLQVARDLHGLRPGGVDEFRGWLTRIARNRAMDLLRARRRRPAEPAGIDPLGAGWPDQQDGRPPAEQEALERLDTARALALIAALPADQAEAVLLRVVMGLDAAQAGRVLGKRAGAVRVAAHRGLANLARTRPDLGAPQQQPPRGAGPLSRPPGRATRPT